VRAAPGNIFIALSAVIAALALPAASRGQSRDDKAAIEHARGVSAARLEAGLADVPFADWLQKRLGPAARVDWEVNDCGEQSGDPSDRNRDFPICVQASGMKSAALKATVLIGVGTFKRGIAGAPEVRMIYLERKGKGSDLDALKSLMGELEK